MILDDVIEEFNSGDSKSLIYFNNDIQLFFNYLKSIGRFEEIDPRGYGSEDWQNEYLIFLYQENKPEFYRWCNEILSDIDIVDNIIYCVSDVEDLSSIFCNGRDYSQESIKQALSGDLDWDWYGGYDIDIFDNVIDDLSPENTKKLKEIIVRELNGKEVVTDDGDISVTSQNIDEIFKDEDIMKSILNDELPELKQELKSLYYNADNTALQDEYYEEAWSSLDKYFDIKDRKWVSVRRGSTWDKEGNRKDRYEEMIRIPISDFDTIVLDYLDNNSKYGNSGTLEFQGSLIKIIGEEYECLRVRFPDYSDSRKVQKNINEMFPEYIM
jgi:hypothetical protein